MRTDRRRMIASAATLAIAPLARFARGKAASESIVPFSTLAPAGELPASWVERRLPRIEPNLVSLVRDAGSTVLRFDSAGGASSLLHRVGGAARSARKLSWRWWASAYPLSTAFGEKSGDDYAARVYVLFDYPLEKVPTAQRWLLRLARTLDGDAVPAATICYVMDPRAPAGTTFDSPYTERVKMIVARSSPETGRWWGEQRDVAQDFTRAFGAEHGPGVAPIAAVVVACDTDQSGAKVQARFGDLELSG